MRGLVRPAAVALGLGALLSACQPVPSPTPAPTPTPTPVEYPTTTHVTLLVYPTPKGCAVAAIPYYAYVRTGAEIVWDVVEDACPNAGEVTIAFKDAGIVRLEGEGKLEKAAAGERRQKRGTITGEGDKKPHKYTVTVGTFVHDPEIEIWP
jgi:hypothetical protein